MSDSNINDQLLIEVEKLNKFLKQTKEDYDFLKDYYSEKSEKVKDWLEDEGYTFETVLKLLESTITDIGRIEANTLRLCFMFGLFSIIAIILGIVAIAN